jgi:murein DD-endopeptidase MepM/ murein hydrolase activator NlpD
MSKHSRVLLLLSCFLVLFAVTFVRAQDVTPPPDPGTGAVDPSGLDAVVGTPQPLPTMGTRPLPTLVIPGTRATLSLYFRNIAQGTVGLIEVTGESVTAASATWLNKLIDFFAVEDMGHYALLSVGMEQTPRRDYPLVVSVAYADGTRETLEAAVEIVLGGFIRQEVTLAPDKGFLLDSETERAELARLESIFAANTLERAWDATGFELPIPSALTSPFGAFRVFNSTLSTRHTGWDIRCTTGVPAFASAAGRVVYAGTLPIRGNHVIIDHGYGVYSGYSHLSVIYVTRGQEVAKDQVVGQTGSTGRTSGAHFHWEMAVNGEWVDSVQFLQMWLPG